MRPAPLRTRRWWPRSRRAGDLSRSLPQQAGLGTRQVVIAGPANPIDRMEPVRARDICRAETSAAGTIHRGRRAALRLSEAAEFCTEVIVPDIIGDQARRGAARLKPVREPCGGQLVDGETGESVSPISRIATRRAATPLACRRWVDAHQNTILNQPDAEGDAEIGQACRTRESPSGGLIMYAFPLCQGRRSRRGAGSGSCRGAPAVASSPEPARSSQIRVSGRLRRRCSGRFGRCPRDFGRGGLAPSVARSARILSAIVTARSAG